MAATPLNLNKYRCPSPGLPQLRSRKHTTKTRSRPGWLRLALAADSGWITGKREVIPKVRFADDTTSDTDSGSLSSRANYLFYEKEDAEAYLRSSYPEVLKALAKVVDGTLRSETLRLPTRRYNRPRLA